jgi:hypothetical protein
MESHGPIPQRASEADERLWRRLQLVYAKCGPESAEWARVVALIASAELAERELAYQIVHGGLRLTSPN